MIASNDFNKAAEDDTPHGLVAREYQIAWILLAVCLIPVWKHSLDCILEGCLLVEIPEWVVAVVAAFLGTKPLEVDLVSECGDLLICDVLEELIGPQHFHHRLSVIS